MATINSARTTTTDDGDDGDDINRRYFWHVISFYVNNALNGIARRGSGL